MKVVLVTGGFDPLHSGHISYLNHADHLGDHLVIGLNSDNWLERKKGRAFMPWKERMIILDNLHMTDDVIAFDDSDGTACDAICKVKQKYPGSDIVFANGGDRTADNIPEMIFNDVEFIFSVGGDDKQNSSSWILDEWKTQRTERDWGYWRVLDDKPEKGYKVKELVIYPGKSLSDQKHFKRSEQWSVLEGVVKMETEYNSMKDIRHLNPHERPYEIGIEVWHKASNPGKENAHILEIQWGSECVEEDIKRRD